jgi:hypothetical protein
MFRNKTSIAWLFFEEPVENKAKCLLCRTELRCVYENKITTGTLLNHLTGVHGILKEIIDDGLTEIKEKFTFKKNDEEKKNNVLDLVKCFASNSLPYNILNNKYFKAAFSSSIPDNFTSYKMKNSIIELSKKFEKDVEKKLCNEIVSLQIDGWKHFGLNYYNFLSNN